MAKLYHNFESQVYLTHGKTWNTFEINDYFQHIGMQNSQHNVQPKLIHNNMVKLIS